MSFLLIPLMGFLSSLSGGSFPALKNLGKLSFLPEVLFSLVISCCLYTTGVHWALCLLAWVWSYLWMQTGHADALPWDDDKAYKGTNQRDNTLTPLINFIAGIFGVKRRTEPYAWIFMAVKGFLISLPIGGLGVIFWPLGYEIGSHAKNRVSFDPHMVSELAAGAGIGLNCYIYLLIF